MRRSKLRVVFSGLLLAVFTGLLNWGGGDATGQVVAQPAQPLPPGIGQPPGKKGKDKKDDKNERPPEEENIPFSFPYDRDAKKQLKAARDYLEFKLVPYNTVCPLLQSILEAKSDSFFNTTQVVGGESRVHRISVKTEANRIIAAFQKDGLEFYQQAYGQLASAMLDDAIKANYDLPTLADLSQRYFHTKAGAEATILLGTLYLERGNYLEAAFAFERILNRVGSEPLLTPRTLFKACVAFKRSGDPKHAALLSKTLDSLRKATDRDGLVIGRKTYTFDQLKAEIDRNLELLRATSTVGEWAMQRGNPARSGTIDGGPPFLDPVFRATMFYSMKPEDEEGHNWIRTELDRQFARDSRAQRTVGVPLPGFFPVTTPDLVIFRNYIGVSAVATRDHAAGGKVVRAGDVRWVSKTSFGTHQLVTTGESDDIDMKKNAQDWWGTYSQTGVSSVLFEHPLNGTLAHDGANVYFIDDVAIPPPPAFTDPNMGGFNPAPQVRQNGELAAAVRAGRLAALDIKTGLLRWELGRVRLEPFRNDPKLPPPPELPAFLTEEEADVSTDAFQLCLDAIFLSTPLPLNGKLYVLVEQAGVLRLLCLDPKNLVPVPGFRHMKVPTLVWSQKLGRPNNPLPQDSIRRFQGCTLAASEGIIVCPTNSGAVVAVDIMSRSLLWAHAYRFVNPNEPRQPVQINPQTGQPIPQMQLPVDRWRGSTPIITGGRVVVTAYDSNRLECLDLRTGKVQWWVPRDGNDLYVGGVVNDRVIVVGRNQVRGFQLTGEGDDQKPKPAFEPVTLPGATPTGHGVGGKGVFYIPVRQDNAGKDAVPAAEVWAVNVETGQVVSKTGARKRDDNGVLARYGIGNLVFQDGQVYAQSAWELACYPQLEQKRAEMDRLLTANPNDPLGLLSRGELLLDEGKLAAAIADFKAAQKNKLPPEKEPLVREKLYVAYTEVIRNDFAAGEPFLEEYDALCVVPVAGDLDPTEKRAREEETERRKRLYLYLLAKGREGQGRLGEAFDHYLALARLGEGKALLDMPDEPNVRMRPDVWARGRIEGMIRRATDAAARKSLEDRVGKEWEDVRKANDLPRLRDFVSVFGPYFATGAEAQFLLADRLLETNNEADAREAQTHLGELRATADDPKVRARATEALARLMVKNLLMEDAVGLYLQLGKEFADVVVRDGKTGSEFMRTLLTDKRLFPYLEPSRYPMPTRVKAERKDPIQSAMNNAQFEVQPGGDLFPMYRRWRFVFDQFVSQNGTWTLRAFDPSTGAEVRRFSGLQPPQFQNYNPGSMPFSKFVQGNGQLLVVQLGAWVYCFDLAEKKERWQKNLLGDPIPGQAQPMLTQEPGADGEVVIRSSDGFMLTLGKSAVLQAGYCALLTRDGLEVVEPLSRRVLWTRRGVPDRAQLHGDGRYLLIIESGSDKRPDKTTLLRATDGMVVEGSPDSGRVLRGARSFTISGRTALLSEGTGDQPRVLRMYDLATGKDLWRREYDAKAIPIRAITGDWAGFVKADGSAEVLDAKTGKVVATLKIDAKNLETDLKPCTEAQVIADADRFYLFLDRDPSAGSTNDTQRVPIYNNTLRTHKVNGPLYAFDRASGKRLWYYGNGLFENQLLILEQFNDVPVIMAASPVMRRNKQGGARYDCPVVVIEKARGRLLYDRAEINNNVFQSMVVNFKNGTIDLHRHDVRVAISPDDASKPENE
ncbi:MAG TPA: PQQ-binding-like beta-propeller repeat protein [Gemmata sp.]|nr:PQQ-binding-like beta-propeller repeat protein [Gemmata sp.]